MTFPLLIDMSHPDYFWWLARERAKELERLQAELYHVRLLLTAALAIAVRHGIADDVKDALDMVEEELGGAA